MPKIETKKNNIIESAPPRNSKKCEETRGSRKNVHCVSEKNFNSESRTEFPTLSQAKKLKINKKNHSSSHREVQKQTEENVESLFYANLQIDGRLRDTHQHPSIENPDSQQTLHHALAGAGEEFCEELLTLLKQTKIREIALRDCLKRSLVGNDLLTCILLSTDDAGFDHELFDTVRHFSFNLLFLYEVYISQNITGKKFQEAIGISSKI